jgi:small-conductance mechanosensitive channel
VSLELGPTSSSNLDKLLWTALLFRCVSALALASHVLLTDLVRYANLGNLASPSGSSFTRLSTALSILLWILAGMRAASILGHETAMQTAFTGLGITGVVVGLAAQATLKDLFGSISIFLNRPFVIGDFVIINQGEYEGYVMEMGFRSTVITTLNNGQVLARPEQTNKRRETL